MAADYVADVERSPYLALYEQPALRALLPPVAGRRVLDAGCGAGRHSAWLAGQGAEVVGLDASPEMLARARARVPGATFAVADLGEPLALGDGAFDVVIASLVLHYLRDWGPPLRELRRVLRPDGVLVFSTHHPARAIELSPTADYFATELVVDRWTLSAREYEVRFWRRPLAGILGALTDAGFAIDAVREPQPLPECRERFPDVWDELARRPEFLLVRAHGKI